MEKQTQSAQYCRACNTTHEADGICGYHTHQFKKLFHAVDKTANKQIAIPKRQEGRRNP